VKIILDEFDLFLKSKELSFTGVIIGGAALNILNITNRVTRDIDFISPEIPLVIKQASIDFVNLNPKFQLNAKTWFNNGPISIVKDLQADWQNRLVNIYKGKAIDLFTLGRLDFLMTKLYAYCDRDFDYSDCIALKPTAKEIEDCRAWVLKGDANPLWPKRVQEQFQRLKKELGYE
jgi:hypothetical protein